MEEKDYTELDGTRYEWLGHSTVRITAADGFTVYTDPVMLDEDPPRADLVLITHHHVEHCLPEYVAAVRDEETRLCAYRPSYVKYCAQDIKGVRTVATGETVEVAGVKVTGVEAYTGRGFHMKGEGCGFLVELRGQRIYVSGDTARIREMDELKDIDVAIVSIADNIHAIDTGEMVEAVKAIRPRLFIPVHFTPPDAPDPVIEDGVFATKDPRFFTRKEDPGRLPPLFEGTGIDVAVLRMLGSYADR